VASSASLQSIYKTSRGLLFLIPNLKSEEEKVHVSMYFNIYMTMMMMMMMMMLGCHQMKY
jgi:hypothetical protein